MVSFSKLFVAACALFSGATAVNSVKFVNLDGVSRTIYSTQNYGMEDVAPRELPPHGEVWIEYPYKWSGHSWSVAPSLGQKWEDMTTHVELTFPRKCQ